jgi:hypothetical protein
MTTRRLRAAFNRRGADHWSGRRRAETARRLARAPGGPTGVGRLVMQVALCESDREDQGPHEFRQARTRRGLSQGAVRVCAHGPFCSF